MSVERAAFYKLFEESPGDLTAYGAFADLLDGEGWAKLAHAFRWMSRRGKWPHYRTRYPGSAGKPGRAVPKAHRWAWYGCQPRYGFFPNGESASFCRLPYLVVARDQAVFATHQDAVMFLAVQLESFGELYRVEPPKPKGIPLLDILTEGYDGKMREPPHVPLGDEGE